MSVVSTTNNVLYVACRLNVELKSCLNKHKSMMQLILLQLALFLNLLPSDFDLSSVWLVEIKLK